MKAVPDLLSVPKQSAGWKPPPFILAVLPRVVRWSRSSRQRWEGRVDGATSGCVLLEVCWPEDGPEPPRSHRLPAAQARFKNKALAQRVLLRRAALASQFHQPGFPEGERWWQRSCWRWGNCC